MHRVFVYGTLKRGEPNAHILSDARLGLVKFVSRAKTVRKFPLVIASEYNVPYLLFKPGHGNRLVGEVFEVENLASLDDFEGCPGYYSRLEEEVEIENGDLIRAWLYVLEDFKPQLLERPLLTEYSSKDLNELAFKPEAVEDPQHQNQVKDRV